MTKKEDHKHIWKYKGAGYERVCEAPFPTIESCRRIEIKGSAIGEDSWTFAGYEAHA